MTNALSGPHRRLAAVDALAASSADSRTSARASVWLLRLAVEHALDDLWTRCSPDLVQASRRAQLLVLRRYLEAEEAWRVAELWNALSRAAHHHPYDLAPGAAEIMVWRGTAERAVSALEVPVRSMPVGRSSFNAT